MATRTTETAVREVIETALTSQQVAAFMKDANLWVTEEIATAAGITSGRLEIIERYLTCALIRLRDLGLKNATLQDVSESYQVDSNVTDYLLRAASFDPTGMIRQWFLASASDAAAKPIKFRVGTGFVEEQIIAEIDE